MPSVAVAVGMFGSSAGVESCQLLQHVATEEPVKINVNDVSQAADW